ncbi:hypothetical protein DV735_g914, partial [Chaetothyriales sp. CBS 134920]
MAVSLNVIALISGGKDSLYSILHCIQNGHKVVALANLRPPPERVQEEEETGELDSMMYQTVGHQVIPLYAEALGLPLYRRVTKGTAVQTGQDYDTREGAGADDGIEDEIEDLFALLQEVKKDQPTANALCSGAILSTYQRTRVESVALRLGLTPLAYLWQYPLLPPPQDGSGHDIRPDSLTGLLDDMAAAMCDARIIKTASAGIPERMLWSNVADSRARTQLVSRMARFYPDQEAGLRCAVLGEGGEYETLAVCGPPAVWKKKIEIDPDQIKTISEAGGACYAILPPATLSPNGDVDAATTGDLVRRPGMFDAQFRHLLDTDRPQAPLLTDLAGAGMQQQEQPAVLLEPLAPLGGASMLTHGTHVVLANETAPDAGDDAASQIEGIYANLKRKLEAQSGSDSSCALTMSNAIFCLLLLSNMDDFAAVNAVYARMFPRGQPNPPARVTIAVNNLPPKARVSLSVIVDARDRARRRALHVQSRSYWAPANIGPYSQAVNEGLHTSAVPLSPTRRQQQQQQRRPWSAELIHLAGQIPLVARTMQLPPSSQSFHFHAVLGLQHLWRVGQEREVDMWPWGVAFLTHGGGANSLNAKVGSSHTFPANTLPTESESTAAQQGQAAAETNHQHQHGNNHSHPPPLLIANVATLPLGAPIEWWSTGLAHLATAEQEKERVQIEVITCSETAYAQHATVFSSNPGVGVAHTHTIDDPSIQRTIFTAIFIPTNTTTSGPTIQDIIDSAIRSLEHATNK